MRYAKKVIDGIEEEAVTQFADLVTGDVFYLYEGDNSLAVPHSSRG